MVGEVGSQPSDSIRSMLLTLRFLSSYKKRYSTMNSALIFQRLTNFFE
ncbi:hypothetical protein THOG05_40263 [Vibrio rotiferianus]|nr:hypothetical protein THOG05_40263 [Vibrio rotiferianus]CAH1576833.1 hypothetical protein THOE12_50205 [Vibrio rotiferianus]